MIKWTILFWLSAAACEKSFSNCLWHKNSCVEKCPEWMAVVTSDCKKSYWPAQRTCENPEQRLVGTICGSSRCDCPEPTVLDTDTGYCYEVDNCPTKHQHEK